MDIRSSKLIRLLMVLTPAELKALRKFLRSPYYKNNEIVANLFDQLVKYAPQYDHANLDSRKVFNKVFGTRVSYNKVKLSKKMTELNALIGQFMAAQELHCNQSAEQAAISKFLSKRKDQDLFYAASKTLLDQLESQTINSAELYLQKSKAYKRLYNFSIAQDNFGDKTHLQKALLNNEYYYWLKKMQDTCGLLSRSQYVDEKDFNLKNAIESIEQLSDRFDEIANFRIYKQLITLYHKGKNNTLFHKTKLDFELNYNQIDKEQRSELLSHLVNYAFAQIKKGNKDFLQTQIDLYKFGLEKDIIPINGILPDVTFLNIIASAAINNDFEFLEDLRNNQLSKVQVENKDHVECLLMTYWHFQKKEFDKSYEVILTLSNKTPPYQLRARLLKLKCLFELQQRHEKFREYLKSEIASFERYFGREVQLSVPNINAHLNFSSALKLLSNKTSLTPDDRYVAKVRQSIESFDYLVGKKWLLEKLEDISRINN